MVRKYKRKTNRATELPPDVLRRALDHYFTSEDGTKKTASMFNIARSTLRGYITKLKRMPEEDRSTVNLSVGYACHKQVFNAEQERQLAEYLKRAADIYFGLCPRDIRQLAYNSAKFFGISMPQSWINNACAGADWFTGFLKRHPDLSIRTPEATSVGRATAFNEVNVTLFLRS